MKEASSQGQALRQWGNAHRQRGQPNNLAQARQRYREAGQPFRRIEERLARLD